MPDDSIARVKRVVPVSLKAVIRHDAPRNSARVADPLRFLREDARRMPSRSRAIIEGLVAPSDEGDASLCVSFPFLFSCPSFRFLS